MYKYMLYSTMQVVEIIFIIFIAMCNSETGNMLSKLRTFKTQCAAFPAQVRELNGEYDLSGEIVGMVWQPVF